MGSGASAEKPGKALADASQQEVNAVIASLSTDNKMLLRKVLDNTPALSEEAAGASMPTEHAAIECESMPSSKVNQKQLGDRVRDAANSDKATSATETVTKGLLNAIPDKTRTPVVMAYVGEGPLNSNKFHGTGEGKFWVYPEGRTCPNPGWDTHLESLKFCTNCKEVDPSDTSDVKCFVCLGHSPGEGFLTSSGFHGTAEHKFWIYPDGRNLIAPQWDTHLDPLVFCTNCKEVEQDGDLRCFVCLGHKDVLAAGRTPAKGLEDALKEAEIPGLNKKNVVKGTDKLFELLVKGVGAGVKCPKGIGDMLFAHVDAPMKAFHGDGEGAVNSVMAGVSAVTVGIVAGSIGGPIGAAVGAVVGYSFANGPGAVISHFDTSCIQYTIQVTNYTNYNVYLDRDLTSINTGVDWTPDRRSDGALQYGGVTFNTGWLDDTMIPGATLIYQEDGSVKVGCWTWVITVYSKSFTTAIRFIASNKSPMLQDANIPYNFPSPSPCPDAELQSWFRERKEWWQDRDAVQHSWAIGMQAPGKSLQGGMYAYYASCDGAKTDGAPNNRDTYSNMRKQEGGGKYAGNGEDQKSRFNTEKGVSTCYWKKEEGEREFTTIVVDLID